MNGIDKIINRIIDEAKSESSKILSDAKKEADEMLKSFKEVAKLEAEEIINQGKAQSAAKVERLEGSAELDNKRVVLQTKQNLIDQAFSRARGLIQQLPSNEYVSFLTDLAASALVDGNEQIVLNSNDLDLHSKEVLEGVNRRARELGLPANITLSQKVGKFDGGLIVERGKVETNCTVDALLRNLRDKMSAEVADKLFV